MNEILGQLARTGLLLPNISAAILAGTAPPIAEIVLALLVTTIDAHILTVGASQTSWNERRQAHMSLAVAFLAAMAILGEA